MNVKKQVIENVADKLREQQNKLMFKCKKNARVMKLLAEENEVMKRERAVLGELLRSLNQ